MDNQNNYVNVLSSSETVDLIKNNVDTVEDSSINSRQLKDISIGCLQAFVKYNWICGHCQCPVINNDLINLLNTIIPDPLINLSPNEKYIPAFSRLKYPALLCLSVSLLNHFKPSDFLDDCLWTIRILIVKQIVIQESSNEIHKEIEKNIGYLEKHLELCEDQKMLILINLMICQIYLWYREVQTALKYLEKAINHSDLNINLEGRLGKKTKYQTDSKSLLCVTISRKSELETEESNGIGNNAKPSILDNSSLPKNVALMDDTLLIKTNYDDKKVNIPSLLQEEEEAIILGLVSYKMIAGASDDILNKEELSVYINYLVDNTKVWAINCKSLYLRSLLEKENSRRVERSMMQLEELVVGFKECSGTDCLNKLNLFYSSLNDPIWKMEKVLADILLSMGCVKSALDFYQKLNLWEELVYCYCRLDRRNQAEVVVRQQLEREETPYLLCILGDVTSDIAHYQKAWELSAHKSSRAQKSLGDWHFQRKEYAEAIPYYVKSLEINSMNYSAWSRLAFASLSTNNWSQAAQAYRRVVQFESDNFEAWNNLSKAYIKLGDKLRAFRTLQESLKCNYEEWRIWENFLLVSIDIGAFDDVIQAWHRLIDIKTKYEDDELIEILVNAVLADITYQEGEKTGKLRKKTQQLLGRITATSPGTGKLWKAYGRLLMASNEPLDKIIGCLQKSHSASIRQFNWEKDPLKTKQILENCKDLCECYLKLYETCENEQLRRQFLSSFNLSLRSCLSIVRNNQNYWGDEVNSISNLLTEIEEQFGSICSKLDD